MFQTDVLIIGCGIAGATAALRLARNPQRKVMIITRDPDPHESRIKLALRPGRDHRTRPG